MIRPTDREFSKWLGAKVCYSSEPSRRGEIVRITVTRHSMEITVEWGNPGAPADYTVYIFDPLHPILDTLDFVSDDEVGA